MILRRHGIIQNAESTHPGIATFFLMSLGGGTTNKSLTQPSPKERALKYIFEVSPLGGDLEGAHAALYKVL
jgi:hypothetical protein